ncbi:hypothetical protein AB9K26_00720 [Psychroserpens sp. XS_ASV72]|uniref:hypothetical protein n=1 Tax=Psychroserpens sp. XS_ASV72 TaxID=3241293 RepID=UPI00351876C8
MDIFSAFTFSTENFSKILIGKIKAFAELDDALVNTELDEILSNEEDRTKFEKLLEGKDDGKKINQVNLSNGDSLFIK